MLPVKESHPYSQPTKPELLGRRNSMPLCK